MFMIVQSVEEVISRRKRMQEEIKRQEKSCVGDELRCILHSVSYLVQDVENNFLHDKKSSMQSGRESGVVQGLFKILMDVMTQAAMWVLITLFEEICTENFGQNSGKNVFVVFVQSTYVVVGFFIMFFILYDGRMFRSGRKAVSIEFATLILAVMKLDR